MSSLNVGSCAVYVGAPIPHILRNNAKVRIVGRGTNENERRVLPAKRKGKVVVLHRGLLVPTAFLVPASCKGARR